MRDLAALLVEAGAASAADVERAAARRGELGGTLDTSLLELGILSEPELVSALCQASGLPPPPPEPIEPDPRARRVFPARVAERHGLAPFRLDGRELSLLAVHPADLAALDEISFMLSLHLVPHVAPEWRVRELMARTYGAPLAERFEALAEKARAPRTPDAPELDDVEIALDDGFTFEAASDARAAAASPPAEPPPADAPAPAGEPPPVVQPPPVVEPPPDEEVPPAREPPPDPSREPPQGGAASPGVETARPEPDEPLAAALAQALSATDPEALLHDTAPPASARDAPPRWSREEALAALETAQGREGVVAVALRYARDFFDAAAVFAVTREGVRGQDAVGWDGARERCRSIEVPPDAVGLFRAVLDTSGPYLGPVAREAGNEAMLTALGRPWPRTALVYPVLLRERAVCILYADNGDAPVSPRRLGDLLLLVGGMSGAFERVLRQAKRIRAVAPPLGGGAPGPGLERRAAPAEARSALAEARAPTSPADADWNVREPALPQEPPPAPATANGAPEPFHVAAAPDAFEPAVSFDPAEAVRRLCGTRRGSAERGRVVAQLVQRGPDAAAALRAAFPGPLDVAPAQVEAVPVEQRGPVLAALSALGIVATPYLVHLLLESDAERRRVAALLLGGVRDPAAFLPLADRTLDPDPGVREAAVHALTRARRDPDFRPVLERLRRALLGDELDRAAWAAGALARLGDVEAVPLLLSALEGPEPVSAAAAEALELLTCRRFGRDAQRWLAWWKEHRGERRADWLFAALGDDDRDVRAAAAERLREAGRPPVPWLADASPAERTEAGRAWRTWWDEHGLAL